MITVELAGEPKGKGRPRFSRKGGFAYTPTATRNYETALRTCAQEVMGKQAILDGPLCIKMIAYFSVPSSWSKKKQADALAGLILPNKKPDADNILKTVDALNGVCWLDDKQIVSAEIHKRYSAHPRLLIEIDPLLFEFPTTPEHPCLTISGLKNAPTN